MYFCRGCTLGEGGYCRARDVSREIKIFRGTGPWDVLARKLETMCGVLLCSVIEQIHAKREFEAKFYGHYS